MYEKHETAELRRDALEVREEYRAGKDRALPSFFREHDLKKCRGKNSNKVLAPHQSDALRGLARWYAALSEAGTTSGGILALPTGAGKTFTAVRFLCDGPLSDGYKVLWLAHTHHLLEQAFYEFDSSMLGRVREPRSCLAVRVVSGTPGHFPPRDIRPSDDVLIATLQTVTHAHREKLETLLRFIDSAGGKLLVVFDEAHHSPAPSYRRLLIALRETGASALGLTATPTYSDEGKRGWLKKLFPAGILATARIEDLLAQGILARPIFESAKTAIVPDFEEPDYEKWIGSFRDIPEHIIEQLARNAERNSLIAKTYAADRKKYGKTIIFTDRWFQCEAIVEALAKYGVKAAAVYSHVDTSYRSVEARQRRTRDENAKVLARYRAGEIDVVVNVRMLTEGTDLPATQTVFLTRQTTSRILQAQMIGRALRGPKFSGTADAYIVSFIDDWQQAIPWAEYDPLIDEQTIDDEPVLAKRPPLQLISIELIKRLAQQMHAGSAGTFGPFQAFLPVGWYRVVFDACLPDSDEIESRDQLLLVFEDEQKGFTELIAALVKTIPKVFEEEYVVLEEQKDALEAWRFKFFTGAARARVPIG